MTNNKTLGLIKICGDPGCEAIFHNIPKSQTRCNDCNGRLIEINEDTFWNKYSKNYFQYDFISNEYFRPVKAVYQLSLEL